MNPGSAFNSYWPMPFRHKAKITMENLDEKPMTLFYQVDYALSPVPKDAAYFHAQFRRVNPLPYKKRSTRSWTASRAKASTLGPTWRGACTTTAGGAKGEIKFYMDGDREFPTINGTGTEDYFNGSYDFENPEKHQYEEFTSPYSGLVQVLKPDGLYQSQQRFGLYRWHIPDPIRFDSDLRVTIQALGWRSGGRYLPLTDDISSVAFWYQTEPHAAFPKLPSKDATRNELRSSISDLRCRSRSRSSGCSPLCRDAPCISAGADSARCSSRRREEFPWRKWRRVRAMASRAGFHMECRGVLPPAFEIDRSRKEVLRTCRFLLESPSRIGCQGTSTPIPP